MSEREPGPPQEPADVAASPRLEGTELAGAQAARLAVEQRVLELEARLAQALRLCVVGELTAAITHEINQPLHVIAAYARASLNAIAQGGSEIPQDLRNWLGEIVAAAERAVEIIRRLRTFVGRGIPSQRERLPLADVVREGLTFCQPLAQASSARLEATFSAHPIVSIDSILIQQVLTNLVRNALEAMEHIDPSHRQVTITLDTLGDRARVCVQDRGPGIPADERETIFQSLYTSKPQGMGMGLAISRTILAAHGGEIRVEPAEPGVAGGRLCFFLPLAEETAE